MKIALISPNTDNLRQMAAALQALPHAVVCMEGGKSRMREAVDSEQPNLVIVEGMCCDPQELVLVEAVTASHPQVAVILLCATQTSEFLINSMRAGVREVLPSPASPEALVAAVNRVGAKLAGAVARAPGKALAFLSCKGGSGATFLATNFAFQLAQNKSVLLIDMNLQFGDALAFVHDGAPAATIADVARDIGRLDASLLAASAVKVAPNYSVLAAPEDPASSIEIKPEHVEAILGVAATQFDYVLLDLPRQIDPLSIKALDRAERVFPVLQANLAHLRNAHKLLKVFDALGYAPEKVEPIVNRFERKGDIGLDDVQRVLGARVLHTMPNSYKEVNTSINQGSPLARMARSNSVARQLADFALTLNPQQGDARGVFDRLFRRA